MDKNTVLEKLIQEIIPQIAAPELTLPADMNQTTPLSEVTDSLNFVELVVSVEEIFGITFEESELLLASFTTIDSLAELIITKISTR